MIYTYILLAIDQPHLKDTNSVNNVAELLMKGGFIMIPILLLSVFSIYLFIERFIYIRKTTVVDQTLVFNIIAELKNKKSQEALVQSRNIDTSLGRILESGLSQGGKTSKEIENYMEATANLEISEMEKNTGYLGIIAGIAPMLGFIGTIAGVIKIFYNISLADNISIGIIAGGLYQKMICSGTGLIVGVIAYSCYHYLQMMIDRYSIVMQRQVNEVIKVL
ncbi:MAG TPA: MotA/TolQ/ExbB proton channel family protein [Bacteroidales bacterium]|nr:MotA/TolQ/ExbB proton channel family protein [Bacteroidales bacterium]